MDARLEYWNNVLTVPLVNMSPFEQQYFVGMIVFVVVGYIIGRSIFKEAHSRAWILSFMSSSVLASIGCYTAFQFFTNLINGNDPYYILNDSELCRATTFYFLIILALDLIIGVIDYRGEIHILTGWIHHFFYTVLLLWVLYEHLSICLCVFFPLEVPTVLLATGSLNKQWRSDILFGVGFISTRILYHGALFWQFYHMERLAFLSTLIVSVWMVHWYWLYGFIKQQQRKRKNLNKEKEQPNTSTSESTELSFSSKRHNIKAVTPRVKDD